MTTGNMETEERPMVRVAKAVLTADRATLLRWKAAPNSILQGECRHILLEEQVHPTANRVALLSEFITIYANNPEAFDMTRPPRLKSGLGRALYLRVQGLSAQEATAARTMKLWNSSSSEDFARMHLPSLVRFASRARGSMQFSAPNLLETLFRWDQSKAQVMQRVSEEYFAV